MGPDNIRTEWHINVTEHFNRQVVAKLKRFSGEVHPVSADWKLLGSPENI